MNEIRVQSVEISKNRIEVYYQVKGNVAKHFPLSVKSFWLEYSREIGEVPIGVALIPFVCNVLPLVWLENADLILPEIDEDFYTSIPEFKRGYEEMYPKVAWGGKVVASKIVHYELRIQENVKRSVLFFSGDVDATASLVAHIDEKPDLLTIWGADVKLADVAGWKNVQKDIDAVAERFDLRSLVIKSNFKEFIKPVFGSIERYWHHSYWGGLQHGIGIIGHAAPYVYLEGISVLYMASTYSPEQRKGYGWASDPRVDNHVYFVGCEVIHDQADYTRQDKVEHIVEYALQNHVDLPLRVCWITSGGKNCCHCEKCYRTIMGLLACGANPGNFGLQVTRTDLKAVKSYLEREVLLSEGDISFWKEIQTGFVKNKGKVRVPDECNWIYTYDFNKVNANFRKRLLQLYYRGRRMLSPLKHYLFKR